MAEAVSLSADGLLHKESSGAALSLSALVASQAAFTQTYSTTTATVPAATAVAVATTSATNSSPYGFSQAQANAIVTGINAAIDDGLVNRKLINQIIDVLQAAGLAT